MLIARNFQFTEVESYQKQASPYIHVRYPIGSLSTELFIAGTWIGVGVAVGMAVGFGFGLILALAPGLTVKLLKPAVLLLPELVLQMLLLLPYHYRNTFVERLSILLLETL